MSKIFYSYFKDSDIENIVYSLKDKNHYKCIIPYSDRTSELLISRVLLILLTNVFQEKLHQNLEFITNELVMNACKSNAKRLYFRRKGWDITDNHHYDKGMENFYYDVYENFSDYIQELKDNQDYIKIDISIIENCLKILIENSSELLDAEKEEMDKSIRSARKFNNLNDVFKHSFNTLEGVGYGLIIVILMLRKMNIGSEALSYISGDGITVTKLTVPLCLVSEDQGGVIADEIVNEVQSLPQFPDSILRLQNELRDPECNFQRISDYVISDSSLSAEVLRIANSPVYDFKGKIDKVSTAVSKIGILGLNSILYNYGATKVLKSKYNLEIINEIKEHLFNVAIVSSYLANHCKLNEFAEDIFVAALLHDIGKIIVNSLNNNLTENILTICKENNIPTSVIENLAEGYNHSIIGAELAKKWNFPKKFINAIRYHHNPLEDESYYKSITYCVYLGNEIIHHLTIKKKYSSINMHVLEFFNLETRDKFNKFLDNMKNEGLEFQSENIY